MSSIRGWNLLRRDKAEQIADTVVIFPPERSSHTAGSTTEIRSQVLEKPADKEDQTRMLELMSGKECEVITGVTIGQSSVEFAGRSGFGLIVIVYPAVDAPGYKLE